LTGFPHAQDMKVLLIEDEKKVVQSLKQGLNEHQIDVDFAYDGISGSKLAEENTYDVIVSDVVMPGMNGLDLLLKLRRNQVRTPVLMLTAMGETDDIVQGLDAGADDYMVKPFEFKELLSRIRALARRSAEGNAANILSFADVQMNLNTRECYRNGIKIDLTPKEFVLLEYFLRNPNKTIAKSELSDKVWDITFDSASNVVEVYINYVRNKIDKPFRKKLLHTVFGAGYVLKEE
jgi:two-component system copper resistance phosphate regulon response regulator CusR